MLLTINDKALIDALVTNDESILSSLKWLTGLDKQQLVIKLRQSIRASINRHYSNRQKLSELNVREMDLEEYRKLDQSEVKAIDYLRNQYYALDTLVPPMQRTIRQFLRDYA